MTSAVQRLRPTDPSRSMDFNTTEDLGRGAAGGGSDKLALMEAEWKETDWKSLGLPEAPHNLESDGTVRVPQKWQHQLKAARAREGKEED